MEFIPPATRFVDLPAGFPMRRGGVLHGARVAYETYGVLADGRDNAVLILTGLSPDAHAAAHPDDPSPGWWESMVGPGKPVDTDRWYVVCVNSLGSCKGSTGPPSLDPGRGEPYRLSFPDLSVEDIADSAAHVVRALGVDQLSCVIGVSMGGMSALALLARHPGLARTHVNICGAVHSSPFAIAIRSLQRELIRTDPHWNEGRYDASTYPRLGMATARKLGMISYRSAVEWAERFGRTRQERQDGTQRLRFGLEFEVESYLEGHAHRFVDRFDPNSYLYLSRCIDWFDLSDCGVGSPADVLAGLKLERAVVIGVETDILFPLHQQREIADGIGSSGTDVQFLPLRSREGHDAFLVDHPRFGPPLSTFLSEL